MTLAFAADVLVDRIGWLLVHSIWQFALIALLLAVALRVLRRAPAGARYAAALVGWAAMLIAPAVTWPLLPAPAEDSVAAIKPAAAIEVRPVGDPPADGEFPSVGFPAESGTPTVLPVGVPPSGGLSGMKAVPDDAGAPTSPPTWTESLDALIAPWLNTLVVVWCVGMCLFAMRSAHGWYVVRRLLHRDIGAVPDELTSVLARVARQIGLKHRVRLLQSPHVDVPVAIGWLRPVVLLPVCVVTGFSPQQLEAILAHELAHIRRHDYLVNLLQNLSETVFFYHPALWWASAVVRREREHCCDELAARALGDRAEYGRALLALEELRGAAPAFAVGAKTGSLLERVRRLAQLEPDARLSPGGVFAFVLVAAAVVGVAVWGSGRLEVGAGLDETSRLGAEKDVRETDDLTRHVVTIRAHSNGLSKSFPAIVMESAEDVSYLLTVSWGAVPFDVGTQALLIDTMVIQDTNDLVTIEAVDEVAGIAVLSVQADLPPLPVSRYGGEVRVGDLLNEMRLTAEESSDLHEVLAIEQPYRQKRENGETIDVAHAIRMEGRMQNNPGSPLLHDDKVGALFINNEVTDDHSLKPYALPFTVARREYVRLRQEIKDGHTTPRVTRHTKQSLDDATDAGRRALGKAASIDALPRFYVHARSRYVSTQQLTNPSISAGDNLFRALETAVPIEESLVCERVFAWDERQFIDGIKFPQGFAKGEPPEESTENDIVSSYRWGNPELGIWRDQYPGQEVQIAIRQNASAVWRDQYHQSLGYLRATLHRFWWGANDQLDGAFNPVLPSMSHYLRVHDTVFDGEECTCISSSTSHDCFWVSRQTGLIRGYLHYTNHEGSSDFYKHPTVAEVAGRTFISPEEYSTWRKEHAGKLTVEQRSQLNKAWGESIRTKKAEPRTLVRFRDFREVAPGIWWPFREDLVSRHSTETGFEFTRTFYEVDKVRVDVDLSKRIAELMPKEGEQVQDQRYAVPVEYAYREDMREWEILKLVDERQELFREGQEEEKRLVEPIEKLVGQFAPVVPESGWLGGERPDVTGKPYLLHFWATWCGPCKNDLPILKRLADDGALIVGMHPSATPLEDVQKEIDEHELNYPTFVETKEQPSGPGQKIAGFPADVFPYCILVDDKGRVAAHGSLMANNGEVLANFRELRAAGASNRNKPFVVRGRVTDDNQQPLPGVEVVAHAGMGTLRRTGTATTGDDGTYVLWFGPGMRTQRSESAPLSIGVQAATISPRLDGWYEVDLHQLGNLAIADHPLSDEERKGWAGYNGIIQPETPYELNFVLEQGAKIEGRFVDEFGRPVAGERVSLDGDDLPPSSSVLDSAETDDNGRFRFDGVPLDREWHFTVRVHGTRHELAGKPFRFEKPERRAFELSLQTTQSSDGQTEFRLEQTQKLAEDQPTADTAEPAEDDRVHINIIAARHVLLLDGKQIVTWEEIDERIDALPDPSRAHPHLYVTRGAMEAELYDDSQAQIHELHRKHNLAGHSVGSLVPRTDFHYDRIETPADLEPDPALRREGTVVDKDGNAVAGAEVVLITPVDESIPYKTYDIYVVAGRLRNPLDELLSQTDAAGRFAVSPPDDTPFSLLALHPEHGVALIAGEQFSQESKLTLLPWGGVVAEFSKEPEEQSASLTTRLDATDGRPEISIHQYWSDLQRPDRTLTFEFTHVPPIWEASIQRDFQQPDGGSTGVPGASVSVLPGETRSLTLGPVTKQQREFLKEIRERLQPRAGAAAADPNTVSQSPTDRSPGETASDLDVVCVDRDGRPVAGAEVYVFQYTGGDDGRYEQSGPFTTDAQGRITGAAAVVRDEAGHFDRFFYARVPGKLVGVGRSSHWKTRQSIINPEGRIEMRPSRSVEAVVKMPEGADPTAIRVRIPSMTVYTGDGPFDFQMWTREERFPGMDTALSDIFERRVRLNGRVEFSDIPVRGRLSLLTLGDGFGEAQWGNSREPTFNEPITLRVRKEAILTGQIVAPDGKPAANIEVLARIWQQARAYTSTFRTTTDLNGRYEIRRLPQTKFNVSVEHEQPFGVLRPRERVVVRSGKTETLDLQLETGVVVMGRAVDENGAPVAGAAVSALTDTEEASGLDSDSSAEDGRFTLRLPSGGAQLYFNSLPEGFAYPDPQIFKKLDIKPDQEAIDLGDIVLKKAGQPSDAETAAAVESGALTEPTSGAAGDEPDPDRDPDGGSKLLREIRRKSKPLLAALAEQHGYGLAEGEDVKRVPMPFDPARMEYYRVGHPTQSDYIPAGPTSMLFHWEIEELTNWGMSFGDTENPGQSIVGLCNDILNVKSQAVEGDSDLLRQRIPGDWVVRIGASEESLLEQLNAILKAEADWPVRLVFRTVERPVYVASGTYELTPLPGESGESIGYETDRTVTRDSLHILGRLEALPDSSSGGGCGDFDEFLAWLGRWINAPIISEVETGPSRELCWLLHESSSGTDAQRQQDHDPKSVLANITKQTGLRFENVNRDSRILFVEEVESRE